MAVVPAAIVLLIGGVVGLGAILPLTLTRPVSTLAAALALAVATVWFFLMVQYGSEPHDGGPQSFREAIPAIVIYGLAPLLLVALGAYMTFRDPPLTAGTWVAAVVLLGPESVIISMLTEPSAAVLVWLSPALLLLLAAITTSRRIVTLRPRSTASDGGG